MMAIGVVFTRSATTGFGFTPRIAYIGTIAVSTACWARTQVRAVLPIARTSVGVLALTQARLLAATTGQTTRRPFAPNTTARVFVTYLGLQLDTHIVRRLLL